MSYYDPEALAEHKRRVQKAAGSTQDGLTPAQRQYQDQTGDLYRHLDAPPQKPRQVEYVGGFGRKPPATRVNNSLVNRQNGAVQEITSIQQQLHRPVAAPPRQALAAPQQQQRVAQAPQPARPQPAPRPAGGGAKMPAGGPNVAPPPQQQPAQDPNLPQAGMSQDGDYMHPMQREGLSQYHAAMKNTHDAIAAEMQSRADQAREMDRMAHEKDLAAMKYQAEMSQQQGQSQLQQQELARRDARNSALMKAAGIGGHTIVNGQRVDPFSSIRQSLLG